jgi:hypothetical protein
VETWTGPACGCAHRGQVDTGIAERRSRAHTTIVPNAAPRTTWGHLPAAAATAKIRRWRAHPNASGTLLGYLDVETPSGMVIHDCRLMRGPADKYWIAMPATRQTDRDGQPRLDATGKQLWLPVVEFRDRTTADRFRDLVLDALRRQHPEAFDGGPRGFGEGWSPRAETHALLAHGGQ